MIKAIFKKYQSLGSEDNFHGVKCTACSGIVIVTTRQTRSADEGMTVFYICTKCNLTRKNHMAYASTKMSTNDAIEKFNNVSFVLDIQTTKPLISHAGMKRHERQDPDANIISITYHNLSKEDRNSLKSFEWPETSIKLYSEFLCKTYELKRNEPMEIIDFICDFEKESRQNSKSWHGGVDTRHIIFSGLSKIKLDDDDIAYAIMWDS